jgi:hypothetical protein
VITVTGVILMVCSADDTVTLSLIAVLLLWLLLAGTRTLMLVLAVWHVLVHYGVVQQQQAVLLLLLVIL